MKTPKSGENTTNKEGHAGISWKEPWKKGKYARGQEEEEEEEELEEEEERRLALVERSRVEDALGGACASRAARRCVRWHHSQGCNIHASKLGM